MYVVSTCDKNRLFEKCNITYCCHSLSPSALCFPAHIWFSCFSCHHYLISLHLCLDFVPGVSSYVPLHIVCSAPCFVWIIVNVSTSVSVCTCLCLLRVLFTLNVSKKFRVSSSRVSWLFRATSLTPNHDRIIHLR